MAREPVYPKDAPVGGKPAPAEADRPAPPATNEAATGTSAGGKPSDSRRKHLVTGAAIGIGSAAIVAALLYANRGRGKDKT
jgi:hypothetical protein